MKRKPDWAERMARKLAIIRGSTIYVAGWVFRTTADVWMGDLSFCNKQFRNVLASALRKAKAGVK